MGRKSWQSSVLLWGVFAALVTLGAACTKKDDGVAASSVTASPTPSPTPTATPAPTATPTPTPSPTPTTTLKNFAVYYSWPSSLNSSTLAWDNTAVANYFKQYDLVVFGAGLEFASHTDHANFVTIAGLMGTTEVWGYVDVGSTGSHSLATLQASLDAWKDDIGADGVLLDEFGFDFKLAGMTDADMRVRQKAVVAYAHSNGLKVMVNAFDSDDVFTKESGNPIVWAAGDKYLYESYTQSWSTRETFAFYRSKVAKLQTAHAQTGVEIYALPTTGAATTAFVQADFDFAILSAGADGFQGVSWGTNLFSASDAIMPYRSNSSLMTVYTTPSVTIDSSAQTLTFSQPSGNYVLDYSVPSFTTH